MRAEMAPNSSTSGASFFRTSMASMSTGSISRRVRSASVSVNSLGSGDSCSFSSSAMVTARAGRSRKRQTKGRVLNRIRSKYFRPRRTTLLAPRRRNFSRIGLRERSGRKAESVPIVRAPAVVHRLSYHFSQPVTFSMHPITSLLTHFGRARLIYLPRRGVLHGNGRPSKRKH
jgi:hypothetical protein